MKKIIALSFVLFIVSFLVVLSFGKESSFEYDVSDIENVTVYYDKEIINCKYKFENGKIHFDITPIKSGNTRIIIKGDNITNEKGAKKQKESKIKIYVHRFGVITLNSYFGYCKGDIAFIISAFIISLAFLFHLIVGYKNNIKSNLYSYKNISKLGLILFVTVVLAWNLFFVIFDYYHGFHMSIKFLLIDINDSLPVFMMVALPVAIILTLLIMISNIILVINEGKKLRNLLGVAFGGFICLSTLILILFNGLSSYNSISSYISLIIILFVVYLECIFAGTVISGVLSAKHIPKFDKDYIIILGCKIMGDGTLTPILKNRVDRAIEFAKMQKKITGKDIIFTPSGGKGSDEIISEAQAMKNYLIDQGISQDKIIVEDKSKNTYQNIKFSNDLIEEKTNNPKIAFSTTNYHVLRAGLIANSQNIKMEGIGAKTRTYYWINAFIREFVATLVSEKKTHIKTLLLLSLVTFIVSVLIKII